MKTFIATTIAITIISCSFIIIDAAAQSQPINFSGNWNRNNEKTDAGGLSINSVALKLEISQDNNTITIKGTQKNGKGEISTYTDELKLDGSKSERKAGANQKKYMNVSWSADKKELTETATYKDEQGNVTQVFKQSFSLTNDGKTLKVVDERTFDGQTYQLQCVFDKQ